MNVRDHFDTIASAYRDLRYTDEEPVDYIVEKVGTQSTLVGADFGAGTGRYSSLLVQKLPHLRLTCVDASEQMLAELCRNMDNIENTNYAIKQATVETVDLPARHFDAIFTFNAVHHFDLDIFLQSCSRWLRKAGHLFIYTRFHHQNRKNIWGRYFPGFTEKEDRLYTPQAIETAILNNAELILRECREFTYEREGSLAELLQKVDLMHYSTFRLYPPRELKQAKWLFIKRLKKVFVNAHHLTWQDFNIMIHLQNGHL